MLATIKPLLSLCVPTTTLSAISFSSSPSFFKRPCYVRGLTVCLLLREEERRDSLRPDPSSPPSFPTVLFKKDSFAKTGAAKRSRRRRQAVQVSRRKRRRQKWNARPPSLSRRLLHRVNIFYLFFFFTQEKRYEERKGVCAYGWCRRERGVGREIVERDERRIGSKTITHKSQFQSERGGEKKKEKREVFLLSDQTDWTLLTDCYY